MLTVPTSISRYTVDHLPDPDPKLQFFLSKINQKVLVKKLHKLLYLGTRREHEKKKKCFKSRRFLLLDVPAYSAEQQGQCGPAYLHHPGRFLLEIHKNHPSPLHYQYRETQLIQLFAPTGLQQGKEHISCLSVSFLKYKTVGMALLSVFIYKSAEAAHIAHPIFLPVSII
jgi:hypothetical protein